MFVSVISVMFLSYSEGYFGELAVMLQMISGVLFCLNFNMDASLVL